MPNPNHSVRLAAVIAGFAAVTLSGQERAGAGEIGFQHFHLANGSRTVANAFGLTIAYRDFFPNVGLLSLSFAPAANNGRFRVGETFAELKRLPWLGSYWTLRAGDFRLSGRQIDIPFSNLYSPEITGRGAWAEAAHGSRTLGFFHGSETLQVGARVPMRIQAPQTMTGMYWRQSVRERLTLAVRLLSLSNDLEKLRESPYLSAATDPARSSRTAAVSALYKIAGPLRWYGEAAWSGSVREGVRKGGNDDGLSVTFGPTFETGVFTFRANFVHQTASYLPLLGYYVGDRRGPFGEFRIRPFSRLEFYGSASEYTNNLAKDPQRPTFRTMGTSAGASLKLPARFSVFGQWSTIKLATRRTDQDPSERAVSQQIQMSLTRPIGRHNVRLAVREFQQRTYAGPQVQRSGEVADTFRYGVFSIGGEFRAQRLMADQSKVSLFIRGNGQVNMRRFSLFTSIETGNDLANRTLFATSAVSTTVLGGSVTAGAGLRFSVEAFRSRMTTELNEQNVFALQTRGVLVPSILSALNQWSLHFRMTKSFDWGKPMPLGVSRLEALAVSRNQLQGSVEGQVKLGGGGPERGVEGIPLSLDNSRFTTTDRNGWFRFENVGEGSHTVSIAENLLPTDFDPASEREASLMVKPGRASRADLKVVAVGHSVRGVIRGPEGAPLESIVIHLLPSGRFTTPDRNGGFAFYNVSAGPYRVALSAETLPPYAVAKTPLASSIVVKEDSDIPRVEFRFEVQLPRKPVKTVTLPTRAAERPPGKGMLEQPAKGGPSRPANTPSPSGRLKFNPAPQSALAAESAIRFYRNGRALAQAGKFSEAVEEFTRAIGQNPGYELAYNSRAYAHLRLSQFAAAVADGTEAILINPHYENAYRNRSAARKALGDLAGAASDLNEAKLAARPQRPGPLSAKGIPITERPGVVGSASEVRPRVDFPAAEMKTPAAVVAAAPLPAVPPPASLPAEAGVPSPVAHIASLAEPLSWGKVRNPVEALSPVPRGAPTAESSVPKIPLSSGEHAQAQTSAKELYEQGRKCLQKEDFSSAVRFLTDAIDAQPEFALALNSRGYAYLRLKQHRLAVADFSEAVRINPKYANAYRNRAAARKALGDAPGAAADRKIANAIH